jgi:hypothetical protein
MAIVSEEMIATRYPRLPKLVETASQRYIDRKIIGGRAPLLVSLRIQVARLDCQNDKKRIEQLDLGFNPQDQPIRLRRQIILRFIDDLRSGH